MAYMHKGKLVAGWVEDDDPTKYGDKVVTLTYMDGTTRKVRGVKVLGLRRDLVNAGVPKSVSESQFNYSVKPEFKWGKKDVYTEQDFKQYTQQTPVRTYAEIEKATLNATGSKGLDFMIPTKVSKPYDYGIDKKFEGAEKHKHTLVVELTKGVSIVAEGAYFKYRSHDSEKQIVCLSPMSTDGCVSDHVAKFTYKELSGFGIKFKNLEEGQLKKDPYAKRVIGCERQDVLLDI